MNRLWQAVMGAAVLAGTTAGAVEVLTTPSITYTGQVVRVDGEGIVFRIDVGEMTIRKTEVVNLVVPQPEAFTKALAALEQRKFGEAVPVLKPLVDRLAGVELEWVQTAMLKLGDAYVRTRMFTDAKTTFDRFKVLYSTSPKVAVLDAKYAAILVGQKKCPEALTMLNRLTKLLLDKKAITMDEEQAVAESLVLVGDCQQAGGSVDAALESYLTVVALFDADTALAAEAKHKAAQIFEQKKNWKRAKGSYQELAAEAPQPDIVADAKKRLAQLTEAHPE